MTAPDFLMWVNSSLLPNAEVIHKRSHWPLPKDGFIAWIFPNIPQKKWVYFDGHERADVIEYHRVFLQKLEILLSLTTSARALLLCGSSFLSAMRSPFFTATRTRGGNGLTGHQTQGQKTWADGHWLHWWTQWIPVPVKWRTRKACHHCPCHSEVWCWSWGYWNSDMLMEQVKEAKLLLSLNVPVSHTCTCVAFLNQSSRHSAYHADALNVHKMNIKPRGK